MDQQKKATHAICEECSGTSSAKGIPYCPDCRVYTCFHLALESEPGDYRCNWCEELLIPQKQVAIGMRVFIDCGKIQGKKGTVYNHLPTRPHPWHVSIDGEAKVGEGIACTEEELWPIHSETEGSSGDSFFPSLFHSMLESKPS